MIQLFLALLTLWTLWFYQSVLLYKTSEHIQQREKYLLISQNIYIYIYIYKWRITICITSVSVATYLVCKWKVMQNSVLFLANNSEFYAAPLSEIKSFP